MSFRTYTRLASPIAAASALAVLGALATIGPRDAAAGEPFPTRAERLPAPGKSAASEDTLDALVLNPANLANMPSREARYTYVRCEDTRKVACGHAVQVGAPLPFFDLATGLRLDFVQPPGGPNGAGFPYDGVDYVWLTWGLAHRTSERTQIGVTAQTSYSTNLYTDRLFGLSAGFSYRPMTRLGFSLVGHDLNGPSVQRLPPFGRPVLARSWTGGLSFRPLQTRALDVGAELRYFEVLDAWRPRLTLGVDVPGVGRARGDLEVQNLGNDATRGVVATAGVEIAFGGFSAGGGAMFGNGLGSPQSVGAYANLGITGYTSPGVPRSERAVSFRVESTPGPRTHAAQLRRLWRLAEDREIAAVTMILRAEPAGSYAHAEELADAFRVLKAHGKKVICHWEEAGPKALYACASADKIVINPAGGLRYSGMKSTHIYLAGLLKKIGVRAEFVRIGAHKSAPEQFMNEHASPVAKRDQEDLLAQIDAVFTENLVRYRKLPAAHIKAVTATGPFTATEARDARFVDGFAFDDEIERATQDVVGRKVSLEKYEDETRAPSTFGSRGRVAILYVDGDMIDGRSKKIPILDQRLVGSYTIAEAAKKLKDDSDVKAVVLRIETGGGSSMAADVMWRELKTLGEKKPLIVSMGSVAASGGYYIASASKTIYACPLTITGSIGIFYGKADTSELLGKLGVNVEVRKTTPRADAESLFRGFTEDERRELEKKIAQFYGIFLDRVSSGRGMSKDAVDLVGQGRVWTGQQAMERGLVDKMGGLRHALEAARAAANLPDDAPIVEAPTRETTLLEKALELAGLQASSPLAASFPPQLRDAARAVAPVAVFAEGQPLAMMEWIPLEATSGTDEE